MSTASEAATGRTSGSGVESRPLPTAERARRTDEAYRAMVEALTDLAENGYAWDEMFAGQQNAVAHALALARQVEAE